MEELIVEELDDESPTTATTSSPQITSIMQEVIFALKTEIEDVRAESRAATTDIKSSMTQLLDVVKKREELRKMEEEMRRAHEEAEKKLREEREEAQTRLLLDQTKKISGSELSSSKSSS